MDVGDIIYLVIVIGSILLGLLKKKKKKARPGTVQEEVVPQNDQFDWEELLSNYVEEELGQVAKSDNSPEIHKVVPQEEPQKEQTVELERKKVATPSEIDPIFEKHEEREIPKIDLRQAIIYSEILKRPDY